MISIWVFILACFVFICILFLERRSYNRLFEEYRTVLHFLDLYVEEYGERSFKNGSSVTSSPNPDVRRENESDKKM